MSDNSSRRNPKPNKSLGRRIIISVITLLVILAATIGLMGYRYFQDALNPLDPQDTKVTQVHIPLGASNKQIGSILQNKKSSKVAWCLTTMLSQTTWPTFELVITN